MSHIGHYDSAAQVDPLIAVCVSHEVAFSAVPKNRRHPSHRLRLQATEPLDLSDRLGRWNRGDDSSKTGVDRLGFNGCEIGDVERHAG